MHSKQKFWNDSKRIERIKQNKICNCTMHTYNTKKWSLWLKIPRKPEYQRIGWKWQSIICGFFTKINNASLYYYYFSS